VSVLRTNAPDSQGDREAVTDAEGDLDSEVVAGDPTRRERWSLASVDWRAVGRSLGPAAGIVALQLVFFPLSMGLFVHGMIIGGLTALIALGMALIYRTNRVLNFAQADLGVLPVVFMAMLTTAWGWPWLVAAPVSVLAALLLGAIVELGLVRRFSKAPRLLLMVATMGLSQVLAALAIVLPRLFGRNTIDTVSVPAPFEMDWTIGGFHFGTEAFLAIIAIPVLGLTLGWFLRSSSVGLAIRAAADSSARATSLGVPVKRLHTIVWSLAALLSFLAVYLRAGMLPGSAATTLSFAVLLRSLAALLIGRLTDLVTIATTAVALGVLEIGVGQNAESPDVINPILAGVILVALVARRKGSTRVDIADSSSWQSVEDIRPIPRSLARLPVVRLARGGGFFLLAAFTLVLPHLLSVDRIFKASSLIAFAVLALSVVVLTGWSGQVSLGQMGFAAIGATVGAKATRDWGLDLTLAFAFTAAVGAVVAVGIGLPALRLRGIYLAVTTLAFALAVTSYFVNPRFADWVPQGRVPRPDLLGVVAIDEELPFYYVCVGLLVLLLLGLRGIRHSRTGRAFIAMRDNEAGAEAYSLSSTRVRLTAFALSGAIASMGGCLMVHVSRGLPDQLFNPYANLGIFSMAVVGGVAAPAGAVLGALFIQGSRWFLPIEWQLLASGFGILLVLLVMPGGLGGLALRIRDLWLERVAAKHGVDAAGISMTRLADDAAGGDGVDDGTASPGDDAESSPALVRSGGGS
jgi:branched-chain amino acid transport system permease protein